MEHAKTKRTYGIWMHKKKRLWNMKMTVTPIIIWCVRNDPQWLEKGAGRVENRRTSRDHHHHRHHVVPLAQISLTLSRHFSQSFIASGRSSGLHPVSSHSCCMYVRAGRPAFAWTYVGIHRSTSLMSSSLLLQQCPACLVRLTCFRDGRQVAV